MDGLWGLFLFWKCSEGLDCTRQRELRFRSRCQEGTSAFSVVLERLRLSMQVPMEELPPLQEAFLNFSFFSWVFVINKRLYISWLQFWFFMCMQVYICACGGQRTTSGGLTQVPSTIFWDRVSYWPRACRLGESSWPVSPRNPVSFQAQGLQAKFFFSPFH